MNRHEFICNGILDILSKEQVLQEMSKSKDKILPFLKEEASKLANIYDETLKVYEESRWPEDVIKEVKEACSKVTD